jgi:hypothetical protein
MIKLPILILALTTISLPASATDLDWSLSGDGYHQVRKVKHRKPKVRYYAAPKVDEDGCRGPVRGVGTQWVTEEGALDAAIKDWRERTRYDHGEIFVDMTNALDVRKRCGRTSIGEVAGQAFHRCEIIARPCKAEFTDGMAKGK